jgi:hypothetical protein
LSEYEESKLETIKQSGVKKRRINSEESQGCLVVGSSVRSEKAKISDIFEDKIADE